MTINISQDSMRTMGFESIAELEQEIVRSNAGIEDWLQKEVARSTHPYILVSVLAASLLDVLSCAPQPLRSQLVDVLRLVMTHLKADESRAH